MLPVEHPALRLQRGLTFFNNLLLIPMFTVMVLETQARGRPDEVEWILPNLFFCAFFFTEWVSGLFLAEDKRAYLRDPVKAADFVSSIPIGTLLQALRLVRLLRLVRVVRIIARARRFRGRGARAIRMVGVVGSTAFAGALALRIVEPETVTSFGDAMWWALVTLSTVGYGDIMPVTGQGKVVASALIVVGIGVFGYVAGYMTSLLVDREEDETLIALDGLKDDIRHLTSEVEALRAKVLPRSLVEEPTQRGSP